MVDSLEVWLEGQHVGAFSRLGADVEFRYDTAKGTPISVSLPRDASWSKAAPGRFLDNLLPENPATRADMARTLGAESVSPFSLLLKAGGDVPGGIVLLPPGEQPPVRPVSFIPASDDEIASRIVNLRQNSSTWVGVAVPARFSLAGVQGKFAMARKNDQWFWSSTGLPSTHILKPENSHIKSAEQLEAAAMTLSQLLGIPTPNAGVAEFVGESAYMVERFDRIGGTEGVSRLLVEDFAQAAGLSPAAKYSMTALQAIELLRKIDDTDQLGYQFIERMAFNTAIANADAHAKNYSLIIRDTGIELAPNYDVLPTGYWTHFDDRLAMQIAGAKYAAQVTLSHWRKLANRAGLDPEATSQLAARVAQNTRDRFAEAFTDTEPQVKDRAWAVISHATKNMLQNPKSPIIE
jgi:serine/threonine-protein kinase HipA